MKSIFQGQGIFSKIVHLQRHYLFIVHFLLIPPPMPLRKLSFVPRATVVLFGPGYLGSELAKHLSNIDCTLHIVARTQNKAAQLQDTNLSSSSIQDSDAIRGLLQQATHIVTTVPPDELGDPVLLACGDELRTASPPWVVSPNTYLFHQPMPTSKHI